MRDSLGSVLGTSGLERNSSIRVVLNVRESFSNHPNSVILFFFKSAHHSSFIHSVHWIQWLSHSVTSLQLTSLRIFKFYSHFSFSIIFLLRLYPSYSMPHRFSILSLIFSLLILRIISHQRMCFRRLVILCIKLLFKLLNVSYWAPYPQR